MSTLEPKKLALLRIWQILLKHSDYDHPLMQKDIIKYLYEEYGIEMCEDFNNFDVAFCDWNFMLNEYGGPYHNRSWDEPVDGPRYEDKSIGCFAPVIYDKQKGELIFTPVYYYIGHFSKFVARGAKRVASTKYSEDLQVCAFKNPDGQIVLVVANICGGRMPLVVRHNDVCTKIVLEPHSIVTALI